MSKTRAGFLIWKKWIKSDHQKIKLASQVTLPRNQKRQVIKVEYLNQFFSNFLLIKFTFVAAGHRVGQVSSLGSEVTVFLFLEVTKRLHVASDCHSLLWPLATTFLKSQRLSKRLFVYHNGICEEKVGLTLFAFIAYFYCK